MHGLTEIVEANERATNVLWLRGRIREALSYLRNNEAHNDAVARSAALVVLADALEGDEAEDHWR